MALFSGHIVSLAAGEFHCLCKMAYSIPRNLESAELRNEPRPQIMIGVNTGSKTRKESSTMLGPRLNKCVTGSINLWLLSVVVVTKFRSGRMRHIGIIMERCNDYFLYHQFMHNKVDVFIINYFFPHDYIQRHVLKRLLRDIRASRC